MVAVAVELDRETLRRPAAIDPPPANQPISLREQEPRLAQAREKAGLQLAQGDGRVTTKDLAQRSCARAVWSAREHSFDGGWRRAMTDASFVARACQVIGRQHRRQIHERARYRRDWNAAPSRYVPSIEATRAPRRDALDPPLGKRRHLRPGSGTLDDPEQMRSCRSAQYRSRTARADSREVARLETGSAVTDAINSARAPAPLSCLGGAYPSQVRTARDSPPVGHGKGRQGRRGIRRRGWDSNPRGRYEPPKPLSRRLPSASRPPLRASRVRLASF
jgi:hypothetical protein